MCEAKDYDNCLIRRGMKDFRRKVRWLIDNPSRFSDQFSIVLQEIFNELNSCEKQCLEKRKGA